MTTPERYERLHRLFAATCELSPAERAAVLERECADDPSLRMDVEALLARDGDPSSFMKSPILGDDFKLGAARREPEGNLVGQRLGRYRITRVIAAGGMGTVYEAEQDNPKRSVAIKVMRRGIASRSALRRFEYEAQILARLRHPGIAQVYEAGWHGDGPDEGGVPYFVMEYVPNARPITRHAADPRLGTRERLELFAGVCDAVHHGHQKGVIHRDLKPANILVDASGQPKIIDFGVARATDSDMAVTTLQTDLGQIIGTLQYMSPEQCQADPQELDTRSDVYSLGVVLYELLCDQLPYDVSSGGGLPEAVRVIREETPRKPSTISRALRGDLETIVLTALDKEPSRRYQSAEALGDDLRRHLTRQPILARPPSAMYQFRKLIARHKTPFAFVAVLFLLIVGFGIWMAALYQREGAEHDRAESAIESLVEVFTAVDPARHGKDVTLREMLDEASETIGDRFGDKPLVEARLRNAIGNSYLSLGRFDLAEPHLERALAIRRELLGDEHVETLQAMIDVGELYHEQDRVEDGEPLLRRTLEICERVLGEEHVLTLSAMRGLGHVHHHLHQWEEGERVFTRALEIARRAYGEKHPETLVTMIKLGFMYSEQGKFEEAEPLLANALADSKRVLGPEHPETIGAMHYLAELYARQQRYPEAESLQLQALEIRQRTLGDNHPHTARAKEKLAGLCLAQGRFEEAETLRLQALQVQINTRGKGSFRTLLSMSRLGGMYRKMGRDDEAERWLAQAADGARRLPERDGVVGWLIMGYGAFLVERERYEEAEPVLLEALEKMQVPAVDGRPVRPMCKSHLGHLYAMQGRGDEAEPLLADAVTGLRALPRTRDTQLGRALLYHGSCLIDMERYPNAEVGLLEAYELLNRARNMDDEPMTNVISALVDLYETWDAAEPDQGYDVEAAEWRAKLGQGQASTRPATTQAESSTDDD